MPGISNLLREWKIWLNNNNVHLRFLEELFIFSVGSTYSSADLHIFIIVLLYICCKTSQPPPIHSSTAKTLKHYYILMQHTATRKCYLKYEHTWNK